MPGILLSKDDYNHLKDLINTYESATKDSITQSYISWLKGKLKKAKVVAVYDIHLIDVVTLNTSVRFKNLSTNEVKEYLIVHPRIECLSLGRLSVLSDLGVALIGHKKGDLVNIRKVNGLNYKVQVLDIHPTSQEWIKRLEERC